jgi:aldose 1-epimerase
MHSVVGRYCNRLPLEEITFPAPDSGSLKFTPQQFGGPGTSLHGGPSEVGWDQKLFKSIAPKEATLFSASEKKTLEKAPSAGVWVYESPDGEGGYPGRIRFEFAVVVDEQEGQPVLAFVYRAKLLDGEACPINLTHVGSTRDCESSYQLTGLRAALGIQPRCFHRRSKWANCSSDICQLPQSHLQCES